MSLTHRGDDTEPGRAQRAPTTPGAVLAATQGRRACFLLHPRWALSVVGARRCVPPGPRRSTGSHAPLRRVLRSSATRLSFGLASGGEEMLDRAKPGTQPPGGTQCVTVTSQGESRSCPRGHCDEHRIH
jgi:hypothetical protein